MGRHASSGRGWVAAAGASWVTLITYVGMLLILVNRYQPKLVAERSDPFAHDSLYRTAGGRLYWALAPIWEYNRFIVPILFLATVGLTTVAWRANRPGRAAA
jgi:hypothetical protein